MRTNRQTTRATEQRDVGEGNEEERGGWVTGVHAQASKVPNDSRRARLPRLPRLERACIAPPAAVRTSSTRPHPIKSLGLQAVNRKRPCNRSDGLHKGSPKGARVHAHPSVARF